MPYTLPLLLLALPVIEPGQPIVPGVPWAIAAEGPRSYLEEVAGRPVDPTAFTPVRDGTLMHDGEGMGIDMLKALDLPPTPALDHDPTPGVFFVAMDGVTLKPKCGAQTANAALNCTPLIGQETTFPALAGGDQAKQAVFQKLSNYYAAFNLVLSTNRPPDWLPYTMAVVGGTSKQAGLEDGVCGVANVACDGAKRNHVSLNFSASCPGQAAEIAAQESAHNWGLEHTDVQSDLMYPFLAGGTKFRDECMDISHETGNGITQCTYVHKVYCPGGAGEQQNSFQELLGVFGPRVEDTTDPTIVSVTPEDGSVFTTDDTVNVSAMVDDDSNFVGLKWTWLEGLPAELQEKGFTRCTNEVCTDKYSAWAKVEEPWFFLNLKNPPVGTYKFKVEVMDAYGHYATKSFGFTVIQGMNGGDDSGADASTGDPDTGDTADTGDTGAADDTATPTEGGGDGGSGSAPTEGGGGDSNDADSGITSAGTDSGVDAATASDGAGGGDDDGGCRIAGAPGPASLLLLLCLGAGRRRRR